MKWVFLHTSKSTEVGSVFLHTSKHIRQISSTTRSSNPKRGEPGVRNKLLTLPPYAKTRRRETPSNDAVPLFACASAPFACASAQPPPEPCVFVGAPPRKWQRRRAPCSPSIPFPKAETPRSEAKWGSEHELTIPPRRNSTLFQHAPTGDDPYAPNTPFGKH